MTRVLIALAVGASVVLALWSISSGIERSTSDEGTGTLDLSVWAPVETGEITTTEVFSGQMAPAEETPIQSSRSGRLTSLSAEAGEVLTAGDAIGTIDGRPMFIVDRQTLIPYRDLSSGSRGPDVAELQELLALVGLYDGPIDGRYRIGTAGAVELLYASFGLEKQRVFMFRDAVVADVPLVVGRVDALRGTDLEAGDPIFFGIEQSNEIVGAIRDEQSEAFQLGTPVSVISDLDERFDGAVASLGPVTVLDDGAVSRSVRVEPDSPQQEVVLGRTYRVESVVDTSAPGSLLIPVLAIQNDETGRTFVEARLSDGTSTQLIEVTLGLSDGRRVVARSPDLDRDMVVLVPGR